MKKVLHICSDFPYPSCKRSTKAVYNLISASKKLQHYVFAIERSKSFENIVKIDDNLFLCRFFAFPQGFLFDLFAYLYARKIVRYIRLNSLDFDVVHGHKLTIDGRIAYHVSKILGIPLVISIRGFTDVKILNRFYTKIKSVREVMLSSSVVFSISPWAVKVVRSRLNLPKEYKFINLPNITSSNKTDSVIQGNSRFVTVLNLRDYDNKGLFEIAKVVCSAKKRGIFLYFDVYGSCNPPYFDKIKFFLDEIGVEKNFIFKGEVSNETLISLMSEYIALVLPSKKETFGMVYIEALFSCCPIIYSRNTGIDGYLEEGCTYARSVDPYDLDEIEREIVYIKTNHSKIKEKLLDDINNGSLGFFSMHRIVDSYESSVLKCTLEKPKT